MPETASVTSRKDSKLYIPVRVSVHWYLPFVNADVMYPPAPFINPRRACAARVTSSWVCVCLLANISLHECVIVL